MKKSLIILMLLFFVFNLKSQQVKNVATKFSSENYLIKSKKRLKTGLILLGGGAIMYGGGNYALEHEQGKSGYGFLFIFAGIGMAATSIPFFISSASNKHKSKLELKRNALIGSSGIEKSIYQTSVSLKINL